MCGRRGKGNPGDLFIRAIIPLLIKNIYLLKVFIYPIFKKYCQVLVAAHRIFSCGMLDVAPQPGINPGPSALEAQILSH